MAQVGHTDPKTTLRIYSHLLRRDRTGVGKALDELIHRGIPSVPPSNIPALPGGNANPPIAGESAAFGPELGPEGENRRPA